MTQARTLSSLVGSMARQGVDKPNVHPIVINGDLMVNNHRVVNNTLTGLGDSDEGYIIHDRIRHTIAAGAGRYTAAPLAVTDLTGFGTCLHLDCTTAEASLATSSSIFNIDYRVEANDIASLLNWSDTSNDTSANYITVSFYMKTNKAFKFTTGFINSDHSRTIRKEFTTGTDWTRHVLTFPPDIGNSPNSDFGEGLRWRTTISAGSDFTSGTLATNWETNTNANMHTSNTPNNFFDSTDNDIKMTGLQMEIGQYTSDTIPDFQKLDLSTERKRCDRYCQNLAYGQDQIIGNASSYSASRIVADFCQRGTFRNTPTVVQGGASNDLRCDRDNGFDQFDSFSGVQFGHVNGIGLEGATGVSTSTAKYASLYGGASTTHIVMSAEL